MKQHGRSNLSSVWGLPLASNKHRLDRYARNVLVAALAISAAPAWAELSMVMEPQRVNGLLLDMYVDTDKIEYDYKNLLVKVGALTNLGDKNSPSTGSQRYTLVLNCETGGQQITNAIIFTAPMGTGRGIEVPDTPDSLLKQYPSEGSTKGMLQAALCKRLFKKILSLRDSK